MKARYLTGILAAVAIAVLALGIGGCRRVTNNGKLDGNWRIVTIEDLETGSVADVAYVGGDSRFIDIQLEIFQLRSYGSRPLLVTGEMRYEKGGSEVGVTFQKAATLSSLEYFGIPEREVVMKIEQLDSKMLKLRTPKTPVTCRRF